MIYTYSLVIQASNRLPCPRFKRLNASQVLTITKTAFRAITPSLMFIMFIFYFHLIYREQKPKSPFMRMLLTLVLLPDL